MGVGSLDSSLDNTSHTISASSKPQFLYMIIVQINANLVGVDTINVCGCIHTKTDHITVLQGLSHFLGWF